LIVHEKKIKLFLNPFSDDIDDVEPHLQMDVIELQNKDTFKTVFKVNNELNYLNEIKLYCDNT